MRPSHDELNRRPAAPGGKTRVLVIDDDRKLCRLIRDFLQPMGYEVSATHSGTDGIERALGEEWHAVILDVMLPGLDGFEVLKQIRRKSDVPVLMLTARGDDADQIVGLEIGADDYLPKGSSTRQLLARLRAITRRAVNPATREPDPDDEIVVADLRVNPGSRTAAIGGRA